MPGPLGVDVQNRAEPVGREVGRGAEEVARGAVDQDVESAQVLQHAGDRRLHLRGLADVGDQRQAAPTRCPGDRRRRQLQVLRLPAEQGSARPVRRQCLGDPSADARPAAGNEGDPISEQVVAKNAHETALRKGGVRIGLVETPRPRQCHAILCRGTFRGESGGLDPRLCDDRQEPLQLTRGVAEPVGAPEAVDAPAE